jgi:hypothetical protein
MVIELTLFMLIVKKKKAAVAEPLALKNLSGSAILK